MRLVAIAVIAGCGTRAAPREVHVEPPVVAASPVDAAVPVVAPEPRAELVCEPYDERNPACRNDPRACIEGHADCKCPSPPNVDNPACWYVMPCPNPPDRRVKACRRADPPCAPDDPTCQPGFVLARILKYEPTGGGAGLITVGVGRTQGVKKGWRGTLLRGDTDEPLDGGAIEILRVDIHTAVGRVHLPTQTVNENTRVRLQRP